MMAKSARLAGAGWLVPLGDIVLRVHHAILVPLGDIVLRVHDAIDDANGHVPTTGDKDEAVLVADVTCQKNRGVGVGAAVKIVIAVTDNAKTGLLLDTAALPSRSKTEWSQ
jgi:hypothetical protein